MGVVMLKCRITGREFSTGVNIDEDSFRKFPDTVTKAHCPYCGLKHSWWTREAHWVNSIQPSQWVKALGRAS